jgi:putative protease
MVLQHMEDESGHPMQEAPGGGYNVRIPVPVDDCRNGLIARYL